MPGKEKTKNDPGDTTMGREYEARCTKCDSTFSIREGPGMYFRLLRCVQCGKEKQVGVVKMCSIRTVERGHRLVVTILDRCPCGGSFTADALPRCPKCGSVGIVDTGRVETLYE